MKKLSLILVMTLVLSLLAGCAGTPVVYYSDCTCPTGIHETPSTEQSVVTDPQPSEMPAPGPDGALKTGLYISTSISDSKNASGENPGEAKYELTMVAVLVDDDGIIRDCVIDGISTSVKFDAGGSITTDLTAAPQTKNELGANYNMVTYGGAIAEWDAQAEALAQYAIGKDAVQLRTMAIDESGHAPEGSDLATSATIYLGDFVHAIEIAAGTATHKGAMSGDELKLAAVTDISKSVSAEGENAGNAQLDVSVCALTLSGETISSCIIDAVQAKIAFDASGVITSEIGGMVSTKNQLGEQYGMKAWGGAIAEWDQQAASFAHYVTGKTGAEVAGIAVTETTKPADADLAASVTIAIGDFQKLISKAIG